MKEKKKTEEEEEKMYVTFTIIDRDNFQLRFHKVNVIVSRYRFITPTIVVQPAQTPAKIILQSTRTS